MKYFILFLLNIIPIFAISQIAVFHGQVVDEGQKGIPFAIIQVKDKAQGYYCDEKGNYVFELNMDSAKTVVVYCMGYEKKEMTINELGKTNTISLQKQLVNLKEVIVKWKKEKIREGILGSKHISCRLDPPWKDTGKHFGYYGLQSAVFLKADSSRNGLLKKVFVFVVNDGIPTVSFRIRVFNEDPDTWMPLHDITDSNLIVHADKGNQWVSVDLSAKKIPVNEGLFIDVDWLPNDNDTSRDYGHERRQTKQQVVIGLTQGYWKRGFITAEKSIYDDKWIMFAYPVQARHNVLNLMAYATYTYEKK